MKGQMIGNKIYAIPDDDRTIIFDIISGSLIASEKKICEIKKEDIDELNLKSINCDVPQKVKQDIYKLSIASAEVCNLRCKYCYAESGTYGNKQGQLMNFEDYKVMFEDILPLTANGPGAVCFFGGEPLLDFKAIKEFVIYINNLHEKQGINLPIWEMVTNGTLFDDEMIQFFKENKFKISISLDGPKNVNDISRVFPDEKLSVFDSVKESMKKIKKYNFDVSCGSTLDIPFFMQYEKGQYESYSDSLYDLGFRYVGTSIAVTEKSDKLTEELATKIEKFSNDMIEHDFTILEKGGNISRVSNLVLTIINRLTKPQYNIGCVPGSNAVFYSAKGKYYPCHLMYESKTERMSLDEMKEGMFVKCYNRNEIEPCKSCSCCNLCMFWCPAGFPMNNDHPNNAACLFQKVLFEGVAVKLVRAMENEENLEKFIKNVKEASNISKRYELED